MLSRDFSQPVIGVASALWHKRAAAEQVRSGHFAKKGSDTQAHLFRLFAVLLGRTPQRKGPNAVQPCRPDQAMDHSSWWVLCGIPAAELTIVRFEIDFD